MDQASNPVPPAGRHRSDGLGHHHHGRHHGDDGSDDDGIDSEGGGGSGGKGSLNRLHSLKHKRKQLKRHMSEIQRKHERYLALQRLRLKLIAEQAHKKDVREAIGLYACRA